MDTAPTADPSAVLGAVPDAVPAAVPDATPSCPCPDLTNIQIVDIDRDGIYKYVAFTVRDPAVKSGVIPVVIVRGYKRFYLFEEVIDEVITFKGPYLSYFKYHCIFRGFTTNDTY